MRATVMFGAGDIRIENIPDAHISEATDAVVVVSRAASAAAISGRTRQWNTAKPTAAWDTRPSAS